MEFPETLPDRERTGRQEGEPSSVCHPDAGLSARAGCAGWVRGAWVRGPPARIVSVSPGIIARRSYRSPFVQSLVRTAVNWPFYNTM